MLNFVLVANIFFLFSFLFLHVAFSLRPEIKNNRYIFNEKGFKKALFASMFFAALGCIFINIFVNSNSTIDGN